MAIEMVANMGQSDDGCADGPIGIPRELFREAFSSIPTPVSIVTAVQGGRAHGTTVSAFNSLSATPPLVMVALDRSSDLLHIIRGSHAFGLSVVCEGQDHVARACALKGPEKFAGISWSFDHGLPRIEDGGTWLACELHGELDGGDHVILVGLIVHCEPSHGRPLLYHRRDFVALEA